MSETIVQRELFAVRSLPTSDPSEDTDDRNEGRDLQTVLFENFKEDFLNVLGIGTRDDLPEQVPPLEDL